jgi:hypothetical protein
MTLLDHKNVNNYLVGIKSLLLHAPQPLAVTVLSDGTLRSEDVQNLQRHITGIRILELADVVIPSAFQALITKWCHEYRYLSKLMHLPFAGRAPLLLFLDSDVIFRQALPEQFLGLSPGIAVSYNQDHDHSRIDPCFHYLQEYAAARGIALVNNLNCGLMLWDRASLRPLEAVEFLAYVASRHGFLHAVAEQDAWTLLASQLGNAPLPTSFLVLCNFECNTRQSRRDALAIHYVSGLRYRGLNYLLDGWRTLRLLRRTAGGQQPASAAVARQTRIS